MQYRLRSSTGKTILPEIITAGDYKKLSPADQLKYKRDAGKGEDNGPDVPSRDDLDLEEVSDQGDPDQGSGSGGNQVREVDSSYYSEDPYLEEESDSEVYDGRKKVGGDARTVVSRKAGIDPEDYDPDLDEFYDMIPQNVQGRRYGGKVSRSDE